MLVIAHLSHDCHILLLSRYILRFLVLVNDALENIPEGSGYSGFKDSPTVRSAVLKTVQAIIKRRMASHKDVDNSLKWFNASDKYEKSVFASSMQKIAKVLNDGSASAAGAGSDSESAEVSEGAEGSALSAVAATSGLPVELLSLLRKKSFWDGHDRSEAYFATRAKYQVRLITHMTDHEY